RRQVVEQEGEGLVNRFGIDRVVVVQDEDEPVRERGEFVEQGRQDRFGRRWLRGLERSQNLSSNIRRDHPQSGDEVRQEASRVVVTFIQRQPGGRSLATGEPLADQRGLPEAGRGRDEGQLSV